MEPRKPDAANFLRYFVPGTLEAEGKLVDGPDPNFLVFAEDVPLASPSAGAAVVAGRNTNGQRHWKVEGTGQSYEEWHAAKLAEASRRVAPSPRQAAGWRRRRDAEP